MIFTGPATVLLGDYFCVYYAGKDVDDWTVVKAFVDDQALRRTFDAAEEIESWLHLDLSDEAFEVFYESAGGYGPEEGLRDFLRDVRIFLLTYADKKIARVQAEHPHLPPGYVRAVMMTASNGEARLRAIPELLDSARTRWSLTIGPPYPLTSDYLVPATTADGDAVVLRLGVGGLDRSAVAALRVYAGDGTVRVLDESVDEGMILLERAVPGRTLSELVDNDDAMATDVVATVLETLWREVPADQVTSGELGAWRRPFSRIDTLGVEIDSYLRNLGYRRLLPTTLVTDARRVVDELLDSVPRRVLLHGDLHHDNIVSSDRSPTGWLAIDPNGRHGDPGYDVAAMFFNPMPWVGQVTDLEGLLRSRSGQLAARLAMDEERIKAWAFVKAVLAEIWFIEDTGTTHGVPLRVATTLRRML